MRSNTVPAERGRALPRRAVARRQLALVSAAILCLVGACTRGTTSTSASGVIDPTLAARGKTIFRYETFGDETFWTDTLHLQQVIQSSVDPTTALSVGLKVDTDSLPPGVVQGIKNGTIDLKSPATTVALLKLNAVVGVRGIVATVNGRDELTRVGITCALCHSTVDNSFAPGIGKRLDGFPNHDLNPGAIIALSPALSAEQKAVYNSWGPGRYDARYNHDGKNGPSVIPPAYGLLNVPSITYTGDGREISYWNRYVAVTQMHGHGRFTDSRLPEDVQNPPDSVSELLPALQEYQLSLSKPAAPSGSYDAAAAARGEAVFRGAGQCATCHVGATFTDAPGKLHSPSEVVSEPEPNGAPSLASRSATKQYRTTPLRALWQHPPYFHNGVAPTLEAVVELYDSRKGLHLTADQKSDLVQYLKTL